MTSSDGPQVFISAAEPSADLHAAALIRATHALLPGTRFAGVAGPLMRQAGCRPIYDMTEHSSMLSGAVGHVHHGVRMLKLSHDMLSRESFDAAVFIDSPVLNLWVANYAKSFSVPVLYYIAPQLWAWGERRRIARVRARVDRIACILPFEEPYFRSYGVQANYVGHPLFKALEAHPVDRVAVGRLRQGGGPILAVMPGSRRHVASENFPGQLRVARDLRREFTGLRTLVSVANPQVRQALVRLSQEADVPVEFHEGQNAELLSAADLALVVSGTVTLEAAYYLTPMIVMYNASRLWYQVARMLITTRFFSLPNILADRELVPEFMPYYSSTVPIAERAAELLRDPGARQAMAADLKELVEPFLNADASTTTAKILIDLIEGRNGSG